MIPFYPQKLLSHALILAMIVISILGFMIPGVISSFGFYPSFRGIESIPSIIAQGALFQFLHGGVFHLFMNSLFLYQAGPEVEARMTRERFISFFLFSTVFIAIALVFFSQGVTIGMSGFCMALLSYLYKDLQTARHPMANQVLIMLVINILFGLSGGISLTAHAAGAIFGLIWWQIRNNKF